MSAAPIYVCVTLRTGEGECECASSGVLNASHHLHVFQDPHLLTVLTRELNQHPSSATQKSAGPNT